MNKLCKLIAASTSHSLITTEQHLTLKEAKPIECILTVPPVQAVGSVMFMMLTDI